MTDYADDSAKTGYSEANGINGGYTPSQIFVDPENGDFRLTANSPARGAGTNLSAYFTTDITGRARSSWDIGAYEFIGHSRTPSAARRSGLLVNEPAQTHLRARSSHQTAD
jgi:hypothetical protein